MVANVLMGMQMPAALLSAITSSTVLAVIAVIVYTLLMVGYNRPAWSHHSMDIESSARATAQRIVKRAEEVRQCIGEHPDHPVVVALVRAYPELNKFAAARGPGEDAPGGDPAESELVDAIYEGIIGSADTCGHSNACPLLQSAEKLADGPDVSSVLSAFITESKQLEQDCPDVVQRGACAIADTRMMAHKAVPELRQMQSDRTRRMELPETVLFYIEPEANNFKTRVTAAFVIAEDARKSALIKTRNFIESLDSTAEVVMFGESFEGFGKFFKLIGKLFALIPKLVIIAAKLAQIIPDLVDFAMEILGVFTNSIDGIIELLMTAMRALKFVVKSLSKGPAAAIFAIGRVLIGIVLKALALALRVVPLRLTSFVALYTAPLLTAVRLTLVFLVVFVLNTVLGIVDYFTDASVRCLIRTDQDPDAWWKVPSHERGNRFSRNILAWRPCVNGFVVSDSSVFCTPIPFGVPSRSPSALLARLYINGGYGELGRKLPRRDPMSLERYRRLCKSEFKRFHDQNPYAKDLVLTLCMCREKVLGGGATVEELAYYATGQVPEAMVTRSHAKYQGIYIVVLAAIVASTGYAVRTVAQT